MEMARVLAASDERAHLLQIGWSDVGRPVHALVLAGGGAATLAEAADSEDGIQSLEAWSKERPKGEALVLVNNAIHPGEPCGVNASLALASQWLQSPTTPEHPLFTASWVFVPQYNVGGASRRNCCTRANQEGPESYGFRGNAANLDLNRDFIKMDSRNAEAFVALFQAIDPDVFVDTHTSNGADYPYTMTLISTQADKAGPVIGPFIREVLEPAMFAGMDEQGWPMAPYVYSLGATPDDGIMGFLETPRYSTGYAVLFGTIGFTTEAHMLKPFQDRVKATHAFFEVLADWVHGHAEDIVSVRAAERARVAAAKSLPVRWELSAQRDSLEFEGYTARREWSPVTHAPRLTYDQTKVWQKVIPFANRYQTSAVDRVPEAWVIPQAWRRVVNRLQANKVSMEALDRDTVMMLEVTRIESFRSAPRPYEGHHPISVDSVTQKIQPVQLYRGDWVIPSSQPAKRYLMEVLSPKGHDAFLHWNFLTLHCNRRSISLAMCLRIWPRNCWPTMKHSVHRLTRLEKSTLSGLNRPEMHCNGCMSAALTTRGRPTSILCTEHWQRKNDLRPIERCPQLTQIRIHGSQDIGAPKLHGSKVRIMRPACSGGTLLSPRRNKSDKPLKLLRG